MFYDHDIIGGIETMKAEMLKIPTSDITREKIDEIGPVDTKKMYASLISILAQLFKSQDERLEIFANIFWGLFNNIQKGNNDKFSSIFVDDRGIGIFPNKNARKLIFIDEDNKSCVQISFIESKEFYKEAFV